MPVHSRRCGFVAAIAALSFTVLAVQSALAAPVTLCVNPGGTSGCFSSIQDAIDATGKAGATINIADGTYHENLNIAKLKLTLHGTGQNVSLIDDISTPNVAIAAGAQVTISNLSIEEGINNGGAGCIESAAKSLVLNTVNLDLCVGTHGGMIHQAGGSLTIINSNLSGGTSSGDGGCLAMEGGKLNMQGVELDLCDASGDGGAILLSNTKASIASIGTQLSEIHNNHADDSGGAIFALGGKITITGTLFKFNSAQFGIGGAIATTAGLTVTSSNFENNSAFGDGGAILAQPPGKLVVNNSGIANNSSVSDGGGIAAETSFSLLNDLIFSNFADESGGGLAIQGSGKISSLTIDVNQASLGGGGIAIASGSVKIVNTIIGPNDPINPPNSGRDCAGSFASQGFNLIFDTAGCSISGQTATNLVGVDPMLDSPGHFDSILRQEPLLGSPVLGAGGHCPKTDEILNSRPHTGCDIGSFESP